MQNIENSDFKASEERLMAAINAGKEYITKTREEIEQGNIKPVDKYDIFFERLYNLDIKSKTEMDVEGLSIKKLIGDLVYVYHNNQFDDKEYLDKLVTRIEIAIINLNLFLKDDEVETYKAKLTSLKEDLLSKIQEIKVVLQDIK